MSAEHWKVTALRWGGRARMLLAQLRGLGAEGERERAQRDDDVEVAQPMGLRVRPAITSTLEAVVVETPSGERIAVVLLDKARAAGAVEAEVGETQLHGLAEQSAVIRIRASGDIELTPKTGRNVVVAGGTSRAAREGHAVNCGAFDFTPGGGGAPAALLYWSPLVTAPPVVPPAIRIPISGTIAEGTDRVRLP